MENRLKTVEKVLLLQDLDLFRFVSTEHLAQLALMAKEREIPAGSVVFRRGEASSELCLLVRGKVRLEGGEGQSEEVEQSALEFLSFFSGQPHLLAAQAVEDCTLLTVASEELVEYLSGEADLCWSLLRYVSLLVRDRLFEPSLESE